MSVDRPLPKDARRDAARLKARQMREEAARRHRRNRILAITSAIVVLLLVAGGAALALRGSGSAAVATPPGVGADGGITTGQAGAPHTVAIYQDYQCPNCKQFDATVGPWLEQQRAAGTTKIEYRPISILDRSSSGTRYSTRSASAAGCLARTGDAVFTKWNDGMYAQQPPEGGTGLPSHRIASIAEGAGAPASAVTCIEDDRYEGWVTKVTDTALGAGGVSGTPTVEVDGKVVDASRGAIAAALGVPAS